MAFLLNFLKRVAQGIALLVGAICLYLAYSYFTTVYHYNYRLTLEVEADGKVYSGSGVVSATVYDNRGAWWTRSGWKLSAWGASPWVDLGQIGIVLVSVEPAFYLAPNGAQRPLGGSAFAFAAFVGVKSPLVDLITEANVARIINSKERGLVNPNQAQLIWMPHRDAPKRAEFYPPNDRSELETRGIKVRGLYVEITNERADYSAIYDRFPWLKNMSQTSPLDHQLPNGLNARTLLGEYR